MLNLVNEIKTAYVSYSSTMFPLIFVWIAVVYMLVKGKKQHIGKVLLGLLVPEVLCGYVAAEHAASDGRMQKKRAVFLFVFILVLIQLGIGLQYTNKHLKMISNPSKTDHEVIQIIQELYANNTEAAASNDIRMMAPNDVAAAVREYEPGIVLLHGKRFGYSPWSDEQLMLEAKVYECNCLVVEQIHDSEERYLEDGFEKTLTTEHYVIYTR